MPTPNDDSNSLDFSAVPLELRQRPQWVLWRYEQRPGEDKPTKVPYQARNPDKHASTKAPQTWAPFALACKKAHQADGIGYVFSPDDPYTGIDLDNCLDEQGQPTIAARAHLDVFASYGEISPSGKGIKIFVRATLPGRGHKVGWREVYDRLRFFTITGKPYPGLPLEIAERQEEIEAFYAVLEAEVNASKASETLPPDPPETASTCSLDDAAVIERLRKHPKGWRAWSGDSSDWGDDESRGDLYLCGRLAYWTGRDASQMDTLFRQSSRMRSKWDAPARNGETYGQGTIKRAIDACHKVWEPRQHKGRPNWQQQSEQSGLPLITYTARAMQEIIKASLDALVKQNTPPTLFVRGGQLVRIAKDEHGTPTIMECTEAYLKRALGCAAIWVRVNDRGQQTQTPTPADWIVADLLEPQEWPFPRLAGIITAPCIRPDGSILDRPGYDAATALYYVPADGFILPAISHTPTIHETREAVKLLEELIINFPFVDHASKANMLALLLSPFLRPAYQGCTPMALLDAAEAGTGKTLLAILVGILVTGQEPPLYTFPAQEEEVRKKITSMLKEGHDLIVFDEVVNVLVSAELQNTLTTEYKRDRLLGYNREIALTNRSIWIATGNNLQLGGDMPRRCYHIRLVAEEANPSERKPEDFRHADVIRWAKEQRGPLVAALLTLCRAWWAAGKPRDAHLGMGSFQGWADMVGGILRQANVAEFLANRQKDAEEMDTVRPAWGAFIKALAAHFRDAPFTTHALAEAVEANGILKKALPGELQASLGKPNFTMSWGRQLRKHKDQRFGYEAWHLTDETDPDPSTGLKQWLVRSAQRKAEEGQNLQTSQAFQTSHPINTENTQIHKGEDIQSEFACDEKTGDGMSGKSGKSGNATESTSIPDADLMAGNSGKQRAIQQGWQVDPPDAPGEDSRPAYDPAWDKLPSRRLMAKAMYIALCYPGLPDYNVAPGEIPFNAFFLEMKLEHAEQIIRWLLPRFRPASA